MEGIASRLRLASSLVTIWAFAAAAVGGNAQTVDRALEEQRAANREAAASQQRVDALDDEARKLLEEYRAVAREADALAAYNTELEALLAAQDAQSERLENEIVQAGRLEQEVLPLLRRMVETLGVFVDADAPFLLEERRLRVEAMDALLDRSDVAVGEKLRRVLEAYQIELHYGHSLEAYAGQLEIEGEARTVDFLRVGRLGLYYRTLDGESAGAWDGTAFAPVDRSTAAQIRDGLRIARRQAAPGLLRLPLRAAEERP